MLKGLGVNAYVICQRSALARGVLPLARRGVLVLALAGLAAACAYRGPAATVVDQRLTWFSFIAGEDLRPLCREGDGETAAPDRYRLVYNADFNQQARGYDIIPARDGSALLRQTVDRGVSLLQGILLPGRALAPVNRLDPITAAAVDDLATQLAASGAFDAPPVGLRLNSQEYYWLVMGCRGGDFFLTGYEYPSDRYRQIRFVDWIARQDRTGVPLPVPDTRLANQPTTRCPGRNLDEGNLPCFDIRIGDDGLVGTGSLL